MRIFARLFLLLIFSYCKASAQYELAKDDSLISMLKTKYVALSKERIDIGFELMSRHLPSQTAFDSLKNLLINEAEMSRDRLLMCNVYDKTAEAYLNFSSRQEYCEKARPYMEKCAYIANENGLENYKVSSLIKYSNYYRHTGQKQKALDCNNRAISLATSAGSDSLLCLCYTSIADTWNDLANKLSRLEALLTAREFAEKSEDHNLITANYIDLAGFYKETEQYEKCKDYYALAINKGREWKQWLNVLNAMRGMGSAYRAEKNKELCLGWYNKTLSLSDSLGIKIYRIMIYLDLLNYYANSETPENSVAYLNSRPELLKFINEFGIGYQLNKLRAFVKEHDKQYDSALYYMHIAAPYEYHERQNYSEKYNFTMEWSLILKNMGRKDDAKQKLLLAKSFADSSGDLDLLKDVSEQLDSAYLSLGDYKNAFYYYGRYNFYKDSLETLGRQKDLLNIEIENTTKRAEQQKLREEALLRQRNNLEYMGITAAIATIFIVLVLFGVFQISPAVIKALGFFAFIFLFEFITLLLDEQIHELTHGEPWKVLAIKIILIAMLLPLHHWLEEKVLHYLTSQAHKLKPGFKFFKHESSEHIS